MRIVFIPFLFQGHLQIPFAIGRSLLFRDPNFEIYFICDKENEKKIKANCSKFRTCIFDKKISQNDILESVIGSTDNWLLTDNKKRYESGGLNFGVLIDMWKANQESIEKLISNIDPDLIFIENSFNLPFIMRMKYKWVQIISTNPLKIGDQGIKHPPMGCGVIDDFEFYAKIYKEKALNHRIMLDNWYKECGLIRKPSLCHVQPSEYFNICLFPKELNYFDPQRDIDGKWVQLNSTVLRDEVNDFIKNQGWIDNSNNIGLELLTSDFLNRPGKLIYFSLGTVLTKTVDLFKLFIPLFYNNSQYRFIVSKGELGDNIKLPNNCVSAKYLNQLEFFKSGLIDLAIIHGGNNSFTEACHYGILMIIIPGFGDQYCNACVAEKFNLGKKVLLGEVSTKLNDAIDFVIDNLEFKKNMKEISKKMKEDYVMDQLIDLIIETCSNKN